MITKEEVKLQLAKAYINALAIDSQNSINLIETPRHVISLVNDTYGALFAQHYINDDKPKLDVPKDENVNP